jgi:hypothetical protein
MLMIEKVRTCRERGTQYNHDISEEYLEEHGCATGRETNVNAARKIAEEAERLIDDEINFHDKVLEWDGVT